ncbi:MAG: zinc-ribbon domain-containing protein, partial [Myxococcota bacterium]
MKFACPSCKTRYSIADEKLPVGASVKFKCKNCGTTIRLKRKQETAAKPQKLEDLENSAASTRVAPLGQLQELREQAAAKAAAADLNQPLSSRAEATAVVSLAQLNELRNQAASPEPIAPADEWYVLVSGNQNGPMP